MALYTQLVMKVEGVLFSENTDAQVEWGDNDQDVNTVVQGAAGVSPGPDICRISGTNAVNPAFGLEVDLVKAKLERAELSLLVQQIGSPLKISARFLCRSISISSGTGTATTAAFEFQSVGKVPRWE